MRGRDQLLQRGPLLLDHGPELLLVARADEPSKPIWKILAIAALLTCCPLRSELLLLILLLAV